MQASMPSPVARVCSTQNVGSQHPSVATRCSLLRPIAHSRQFRRSSTAFKGFSQRLSSSRGLPRLAANLQDEEELPPWARNEKLRKLASGDKPDLPFFVFLLGSAIVAIAATGSWFELANKNAIFGVLKPDNPLYSIILGTFGVTGYPTAGYLFYRAIQSANKESERVDKADGY